MARWAKTETINQATWDAREDRLDELAQRIAELEAVLLALVLAVDEQHDGLDPTARLVQAMMDAKSYIADV